MMKYKLIIFNSIFLLVIAMNLTGCDLVDAFVNVFDAEDTGVDAGYSYLGKEGDSFNYSEKAASNGVTLQSYLYSNIFFEHEKKVADTINLGSNADQRQYFFYFRNTDDVDPTLKFFYQPNYINNKEVNNEYSYSKTVYPINIYNNTSFFTIDTDQKPNHKSNYFFNSEHPVLAINYQCNDYIYCSNSLGEGGFSDRTKIITKKTSVYIPSVAQIAQSSTPLDDYSYVGVARNGILLMQSFVGTGETYFDLKYKLDEYYGVPGSDGGYYYFVEPVYFTGYDTFNYFVNYEYEFNAGYSRFALIGLALDGFPIYGPFEYKQEAEPTNLDACRGHIGLTGDVFNNTYHYHVKAIDYIQEGDTNLFIDCFSGIPHNHH